MMIEVGEALGNEVVTHHVVEVETVLAMVLVETALVLVAVKHHKSTVETAQDHEVATDDSVTIEETAHVITIAMVLVITIIVIKNVQIKTEILEMIPTIGAAIIHDRILDHVTMLNEL